jgi:hypothetical protein
LLRFRFAICIFCATTALAAEPPRSVSVISGRLYERGSAVPIPNATIETATGEITTSDGDGNFSFEVPPGDVALAISASGYETLKLVEKLPPNTARTVEYRLLPMEKGQKGRYVTVAHGAAQHEGERFTLRDEELQKAPGAAGDPFRVIGYLPGVLAPIPVLPIYVVRGGSPGMNGFYLDGMRVPQLFHLVFVDGVVHPRLLDRIDFYPGSYDATFGRNSSGIVDASTRPARTDAPAHGDLELRIYDASALVEARLPGGVSAEAAGRYGFPGPMIGLVQQGVDLTYWDYQLRVDWRGLTLEALGSYDSLTLDLATINNRPGQAADQFLVEFYRIQLRDRYKNGNFDLEAALVGGLDRMSIFGGQGVQKLALSARINARYKLGPLTFAGGLDSEISRFTGENFETDATRSAPDALGELSGDRDGVVGGAFAQAALSLDQFLHRPASITAGVRADVYHSGPVTLLGVDPRLTFRYSPINLLEFFGGIGQYSQAPSFPVPLPGIDTFALQLGLQRAWQGSVGLRFKFPEEISLSLTGYYGRFTNINDVVIDFVAAACTSAPPESVTGLAAYITRQVDGAGYGLELLLRRQTGRVSGWLSYTLSRSERQFSCGLAPSDFDQTHVLNLVVQVRLPWRLMAGARLNIATGRPYTLLQADIANATFTGSRNNQRLPTYVQLDLRIDREWVFQRWALAVFLEALNVTYSESIYGVTFPKDPVLMVTRYDQPEFEGFKWVIPSIGVRGRF